MQVQKTLAKLRFAKAELIDVAERSSAIYITLRASVLDLWQDVKGDQY